VTGVAAGLAVACSSSGSQTAGKDTSPIVVGVIAPLSGSLAGLGEGIYSAVKTFVDQANQAGGVDGRQLRLMAENDQNDPAVGVAAAQQLKSAGAVVSFMPGIGAVLNQVLPVLMKEKILVISNDTTDSHATDVSQYPYDFPVEPIISSEEGAMVTYAADNHLDNIGVIGDGTNASDNFAADFTAAAKSHGLRIVTNVTYSPTAVDVATQVSQLKAAHADAIATTGENQLGAVYAALKQLRWDPVVLGTVITPLSSPESATDHTVYPCFAPLSVSAEPDPGRVSAIQALAKAGVKTVLPDLAPIYRDEVQLFIAAVKKAGSLDPGALKSAMESFRGASFTSPGYTYTYTKTDHAGAQVAASACPLTPVSKDGLPISVAS
jgi:ABC-type branched-subunit amino acid transport system substrate-binding protein